MADTSDYNDGLENQGPDPLSYASAADIHQPENNHPSHSNSSTSHFSNQEHQHQEEEGQQHHHSNSNHNAWTHDDLSNNNSHNNSHHQPAEDSTNNTSSTNTSVIYDNNGSPHRSNNYSSSHTDIMDNSDISVGFEDGGGGGMTTVPSLPLETSGHVRLGREGSGDGGSIIPSTAVDNIDIDINNTSISIKDKDNKSSKHSRKDNNKGGNSSSAESTPRRSASTAPSSAASSSSATSRAKSANPPTSGRAATGGDRMTTSADMSMLDMKTSWDGSAASKGEDYDQHGGHGTSGSGGSGDCGGDGLVGSGGGGGDGSKTQHPSAGVDFTYTKLKYRAGMLADPAKIAKEREREERVRQARERLDGERRKKLEELREQQRLAQENREKQLEMRRQKIEDLRKRDNDRRAAVEERRRMKEEIERLRKESILQKAEERVARYEAWRAGGRKGGRGQMVLGFGSSTPRRVCLPFERPRRSSSHSALHSLQSPNGSDMDSMRPQRRALSACSAVRRHVCLVNDANQMALETTVTNSLNTPAKGNLMGMEGGGGTPRHLSMSTSVLYSKRHSDFSSSTTLSPANRPESTLALDTIREGRRSFLGRGGPNSSSPNTAMSSSFHATTTNTPSQPSPVRMRERGSAPRKPRPASVGSSMPSFVGGEPAKNFSSSSSASRSKSSDRMARDRSKTRPSRRKDKAVSKDTTTPQAKKVEAEDEKDGGTGGTVKKTPRHSLSFFDRLATPKFQRNQDDQKDTPAAKKESPIVRVDFSDDDNDDEERRNNDEIDEYMAEDTSVSISKLSPRKAYSTTNLSSIKKKTSFREMKTTKADSSTPTPKHVTPRRDHSASSPRTTTHRTVSPAPNSAMSKSATAATSSPRITPPLSHSNTSSPHPTPTPSISVTSHHGNTPTPATPSSTEDGTATPRTGGGGGTNQDISEEAYKAKIAEKRRQAREKAEKEAEEERKRQEEERLAEEEKERQEEEEQCRLEEETIRLAEEARKAEEERLQRAIEAEEKRKRDEAERLEQERKAKEEADRKAKEEAERIEKEKQERAKKEDEERMERKKKLEMIMKRVKTDPAQQDSSSSSLKMESPLKSSGGSSPNRSALASPEVQEMPAPFAPAGVTTATEQHDDSSSSGSEDGQKDAPAVTNSYNINNSELMTQSEPAVFTPVVRSASFGDIIDSADSEEHKEMEKGDSLTALSTPVKSTNGNASEPSSTEVKSRFKSPLLQQLVENKGNSDSPSGTPKFKSPLLQNLLGKTKVGARMGLSASMGDLNLNKDNTTTTTNATTTTNQQPQGSSLSPSSSLSPAGSNKEISKTGEDEDKDVDESVGSSSCSSTSGNDHQESFKLQSPSHHPHPSDDDVDGDHNLTNGVGKSSEDEGGFSPSPQDTKLSPLGMMDSALGSSIEPQQGDGVMELSAPGSGMMANGHNHGASSETDKPAAAPTSFNQFNYQSGQSSSQDETEEEEEEENEEGRGEGGNGRFEELIDLPYSSPNGSGKAGVSPIIAFEENNSLRTADVGESLS